MTCRSSDPQSDPAVTSLSRAPIVLQHHVLEVLVVGDGDEGVEVLAGELVLEAGLGGGGAAEGGELGHEGGELDAAVDGEDLGLAADVGELVVVGAGLDLAAVAAHEADAVAVGHGVVPGGRLEVDVAGARRGVARVRVRRVGVRVAVHGRSAGDTLSLSLSPSLSLALSLSPFLSLGFRGQERVEEEEEEDAMGDVMKLWNGRGGCWEWTTRPNTD
ncbi:hypothetical protein EUGRSUZ_F02169 [Eucalyptus grandis]|uniref:Uncharacterized protein n=2 Tax=Eucalyptus grandis TaxID=71139 RepID=A0ACC3KJF6_EUCGR|nr:hypothetical protein EUGRSUZ_F02169 [Eucalyptus grandis]